MENASKAVVMAGGVLIAVSLISLALYAYSYFKDYANSSEQLLTLSQIESFNRFYESFDEGTDTLRGVDVLNIYKKAVEDGFTAGVNLDISGISNTAWITATNLDLETQGYKLLNGTYGYELTYSTSTGQIIAVRMYD